jgi:hypothetical protein
MLSLPACAPTLPREMPAISTFQPRHRQKPRQFQHFNPPASKTAAISTFTPSKFHHSHISHASHLSPRITNMNSILDKLSPETKETLIAWSEEQSYKAVSQRAAKPVAHGGLDLKISPATLCRLYTTHGIAETKQARAEYIGALQLPAGATLADATYSQLETRLFELASRPNPSLAELRLVFQITSRLRALQLSERRVVVAEKRETRAANPQPLPPNIRKSVPTETIKHRVRVILGKEAPDERDAEIERQQREIKALERRK